MLLTNLQSGLYIPKRHIFLGRCQSDSGPLTPQNSHAIGLLILQWTLENLHVKPRSKWDNLRVFKYGTSGGGINRLPRVVKKHTPRSSRRYFRASPSLTPNMVIEHIFWNFWPKSLDTYPEFCLAVQFLWFVCLPYSLYGISLNNPSEKSKWVYLVGVHQKDT